MIKVTTYREVYTEPVEIIPVPKELQGKNFEVVFTPLDDFLNPLKQNAEVYTHEEKFSEFDKIIADLEQKLKMSDNIEKNS